MEKKILITGPTGIIGKELVGELQRRGLCFRIALREISKSEKLPSSNCPVVLFDYKNPKTFSAAFDGITDLFLATPISYSGLDELIVPVLESAKKCGVRHVVSLGAIGVEQNHHNPLSVAEKCVQGCGLHYTIFRPNFLMQNFFAVIPLIRNSGGKMQLPAGDSRVSLVDAADIAAAAAQALIESSHDDKTYVLTGGQSIDFYQIAHIISKVTLKTVTYIPVNHSDSYAEMVGAGWSSEKVRTLTALFEIIRQGWCEEIRPDLRAILGREPETFEAFVLKSRDMWDL